MERVKLFWFMVLASMLMFSCGGEKKRSKPSSNKETKAKTEKVEKAAPTKEVETDAPEPVVEKEKGNDWDGVLDKYEKYIGKYIKLMKKAAGGDASAVSEYAEVLEDATGISEDLSDARNDLTPKQMARFMELQGKLANAAVELNK